MEKFKEKRIVQILFNVVITGFIMFILSLILSLLNDVFLHGLLILPFLALLSLIAGFLSNKNQYTSEFLKYFENKLTIAITLSDHKKLLDEFIDLAIEDKTYRLSYPIDLKKIHQEILNKIEVLEKNVNS